MTLDDVRACLEGDGWPVEAVSPSVVRSRFRGKDRTFHVLVHLEASFATFAVIPFARMPDDDVLADAVAARLLRLNRDMNMAKFSIDEDGDVVLSVEYPLQDLDPSEVRDAVDQLSFYADKYRPEVDLLLSQQEP